MYQLYLKNLRDQLDDYTKNRVRHKLEATNYLNGWTIKVTPVLALLPKPPIEPLLTITNNPQPAFTEEIVEQDGIVYLHKQSQFTISDAKADATDIIAAILAGRGFTQEEI